MKQLKQAINPESGTINYTYDANSNLQTKFDARSITTTYSYDTLNRVMSRTYSDSTPSVSYKYDAQALLAGAPTFTRGSSIGKLVAVTYGSTTAGTYTGYDQLGRVNVSYQQTDSTNYGFAYAYNLASEMTTETYPSGRQVITEYDTAGRAAGIRAAAVYYAGATAIDATNRIQYASHGAVSVMKLGNGKWEHATYDPKRLQPTLIGLGTSGTDSSILKLDYEYTSSCQTGNNGNVLKQTINASGLILTQTYCYDALNRLSSASENSGTNWTQTYGLDRYGNRWLSGYIVPGNESRTPTSQSAFNQSNNQIQLSGFGYDAAGNLKNDPTTPANAILYDAENRQLSFTKAGTTTYSHDGDGHRVKKITGSVTTVFVYNASGQLTAEYTNDTTPPVGGGGTSYLTSDHLGSTRLVMKSDGTTVKARYDYLPFGEEIPSTIGGRGGVAGYGGADSTKQKFTQKERDIESGLDYFGARYYSRSQGRFTSSDPLLSSATVYDPQTWNRYSYTLNNPLKYIDPFGLYVFDRNATDDEKKKFRQGLKDLAKSRDSFKKGSDEYKRIDRSLKSYGKEGVDNGVSIIFGATKSGAPANTSVGIKIDSNTGAKVASADNPTGQDTRVTIDPKQNTSADDYVTSVGHEGSHVADGSDLVGALPTDLTSAAAQAILGGPLNLTKYVTETRAYAVESFIVQGLRKGTLTVGPGRYEIWNAGWSEADRATTRSAGIDKVLAYPKSQGGLYEVTPTNQGKKLIE